MTRKWIWLFGAAVLASVPVAAQQTPTAAQTRQANIKAYVDLLRRDIKSEKVGILTQLMGLNADESAKFWPVYNEYDKELTKLGDEKVALVRTYAENYGSMTPEVASRLALGALDIESRRTDLKRQYFRRLSQDLNPILAARFVQIENQLEKIVDLQISSSLPIVE